MARQIPFEIIHMPMRYISTVKVSPPGLHAVSKAWKKLQAPSNSPMFNLMAINETDQPWNEQTVQVGYQVSNKQISNITLPAGDYLSGRVLVDNEPAYIAAWDALLEHAIKHDFEIFEDGYDIEELLNPESLLSEASDLIISVPIKKDINTNT